MESAIRMKPSGLAVQGEGGMGAGRFQSFLRAAPLRVCPNGARRYKLLTIEPMIVGQLGDGESGLELQYCNHSGVVDGPVIPKWNSFLSHAVVHVPADDARKSPLD